MREAVIVCAVRSPMGKGKRAGDGRPGGALSELHPVELPGQTIRAPRIPTSMPGAVHILATAPLDEIAGRVVSSQELLLERGVMEGGGGIGVDPNRRVSGFAVAPTATR